ncbi:MAG: ATP-binding protein [Cytophagales bacterium]
MLNKHLINLEWQIKQTEADIQSDFSKCESVEYPKIYLESIVLNLLTNAIKYKSKNRKPKINFTTNIDKDGIIFLVCEDNGLGIDMQKHEHKLFGLKKTFHEHPDAKGVGLFITKNQIETMGGTIFAESEIDKGTKFTIQFNKYINQWKEN